MIGRNHPLPATLAESLEARSTPLQPDAPSDAWRPPQA
jgi:hypothetical protein